MIQRYSHFFMTRLTSKKYMKFHKRFEKWKYRREDLFKNPNKYNRVSLEIILFISSIYICILAWINSESEILNILYPELISKKIEDLSTYSKKLTYDQLVNVQNRYMNTLRDIGIIGG